ncbi:MAG TPA: DUF4331 family protein [Gemmatimonadales bacterium]|nr:DUF4331 family protein [Gemmatimonadales bacterium]
MSNHFTGLSLGPPLGDPRLDLTDLYAFQSPADPGKTVLILCCNTFAQAADFHPDAVYRINIDNDGDAETDVALSYVFSESQGGRQTATAWLATGPEARSAEAVGTPIITDAEVSFGPKPTIVKSGPYTFFAGLRSDAFFVDFEGILGLFDHTGGRNFTSHPNLGDTSPWTGRDRLIDENVFGIVLELPTSVLGADPEVRMWGRCSVHRDGQLVHTDRDGNPTVASFFNTDETKEEYNRTEPVHDRERFLEQFIHILGHTGGYTREEAIAAIDADRLLPDMMSYDPSKPAGFPNGRRLTDHVVAHRLAFISKGEIPPDGLTPHRDLLQEFPYLGPPHPR